MYKLCLWDHRGYLAERHEGVTWEDFLVWLALLAEGEGYSEFQLLRGNSCVASYRFA